MIEQRPEVSVDDHTSETITRAPLTAGNRADFNTPGPGLEGALSLDKLVLHSMWPRPSARPFGE